ncbi:hypothetical protein ACFFQF_31675 [Haladaptatus pallidirubidus]|uniref:hypothetical protein n=1 Tax=Haladaptatus pallidirubidus TaxID=1008152 RepID=UPI0035E59F68
MDTAGEDIDVYLHEGAKDGPVVASGASLQNPEKLSGQVDGGTMYFLEIKPYTNVTATYTATLTARKALAKQPSGPYGIYRPSVGTPGDYVMSTLSENDAYQTYPTITEHPEKQGTEVWYGRLSGTSMASPVLCGISTLVYDAYYQNHGEFPDPLDVVKLVEATATDARTGHNTWNIGAGFADATTAVERAESGNLATFNEVNLAVDGEVTESIFHAQGTRVDDGSAFTAGQTNQVELTLTRRPRPQRSATRSHGIGRLSAATITSSIRTTVTATSNSPWRRAIVTRFRISSKLRAVLTRPASTNSARRKLRPLMVRGRSSPSLRRRRTL